MPQARQVVIFDMDGTLIRPQLDFDRIRREIGIPGQMPILEAMQGMAPPERARAAAILEGHEAQAAASSVLHPGAVEVVAAVRAAGLPAVLMTRNSRKSTDVFQRRHEIVFDWVQTRDDGPMKPSPEPIFTICRTFDVHPHSAWTIGDYHYDILCGIAAGATTVLLLPPDRPRPPWVDEADYVIRELADLLPHLGIDAGVAN